MVTFLTTKIRLEETFRTLRMAFTSCKLPAIRTGYALISTRTPACGATQRTSGAFTAIAVVPVTTRNADSVFILTDVADSEETVTSDLNLKSERHGLLG
jgi:hypothetical protein